MAKSPVVTSGLDTAKSPATTKAAFVPKVLKNVTLPIIKHELDVPVYIQITGEMFEGKELKGTGDKAKMEPATLCHAINLETGEEGQYILNAVVKGNLDEHYPNGNYVGKGFAITKHEKREGKRYNDFSIQEIEV